MARPIELVALSQIAKAKRISEKLARQRLRRAIDNGQSVPSTTTDTRWVFRKKDVPAVVALISNTAH